MTTYWTAALNGEGIDGAAEAAVQEAAAMLRSGKLVAFPTETVYGLGADAGNDQAVAAIFEAKGRPSDNPLIVHIASMEMLDQLTLRVDPVSRHLAEVFWPGPLTLVLPVRSGAVSPAVTAGLDTVAVRMPAHPLALALIGAAGVPVAAPSANRSGRPSPTLADHVRHDLDGRIAGLLDGGPAGIGLESTVVMMDDDRRLHILRPGGVTPAELEQVSGCAVVVAAEHGIDSRSAEGAAVYTEAFQPRSPGVKYSHYAPRGRLIIVRGSDGDVVSARIRQELADARNRGQTTGVLAPAEHVSRYLQEADMVEVCGSLEDPKTTGRQLFAALRRFDEAGIACIYAETFSEEGIGLATMNRLFRAANYRIVEA